MDNLNKNTTENDGKRHEIRLWSSGVFQKSQLPDSRPHHRSAAHTTLPGGWNPWWNHGFVGSQKNRKVFLLETSNNPEGTETWTSVS